MGNWSPYSEEWEKQHIKKLIEKNDAAQKEFENKPKLYKAFVRFFGTIEYYWSLLMIHSRMLIDKEYRKEIKQAVTLLEEKALKAIVDVWKDDGADMP